MDAKTGFILVFLPLAVWAAAAVPAQEAVPAIPPPADRIPASSPAWEAGPESAAAGLKSGQQDTNGRASGGEGPATSGSAAGEAVGEAGQEAGAGMDSGENAGRAEDGDAGEDPEGDPGEDAEKDGEGEGEGDGEDEEADEDSAAATLFGERWHRAGPVAIESIYIGQLFNNARGGISTQGATRYRGNLDLSLTLDTENAGWWKRGQIFVYLQQSHGRTLSQDFVGDGQFYSNIDTTPRAADLTRLGEYWYQHSFEDELLSLRLGRQDANTDFAFADLGGDFVNSSFVTLPNIPLPTWPTQTLGLSGLFQASDRLRLGGGVYDHGEDFGQWWATTASRGMFFIGQADWQPFADLEDSQLTLIRLGSWYTTSDTDSLDGGTVYGDNYGFYTTLDRMLVPETDDAGQGLGVFAQFSWATPSRNQLDRNYGAGLVYRGLVPDRDSDVLGLGFSLVEFSPTVRNTTGQTSENAVELFYKAQLREWLSFQPDIQYIARPNGIERDALVVGFGFEAAF